MPPSSAQQGLPVPSSVSGSNSQTPSAWPPTCVTTWFSKRCLSCIDSTYVMGALIASKEVHRTKP